LETALLEEQKRILGAYIAHLTQPACYDHAKNLLANITAGTGLSQNQQTNNKSKSQSQSSEARSDASVKPAPLHSDLNPVSKIQILEEDIEDFGAWKILLSNDAMGHLRQLRRGDRHMFDIVRKKMQ
jgi:hypothetical protein